MGYPLLDQIKAGDKLVADGGFDCIPEGQVCEVHEDEGGTFVHCKGPDGTHDPAGKEHHYLEGQRNDADECVGFTRVDR
jgi:hypothetical protein